MSATAPGAVEAHALCLGEGLEAFIDDGRGEAWRTRAGDAAVIRCLIRWGGDEGPGPVAHLKLRAPGLGAAMDAGEDADLALTFLARGEWSAAVARHAGDHFLPEPLVALALAAAFPAVSGAGRTLYRRAKCQELVSEVLHRAEARALVPCAPCAGLTMAEMERLMQARRLIAERFTEKLTLDLISRAVGLNRAKLTQGFRRVFGQTVAECLAEHRLSKAAADLRATNRPVSLIGYGAGYLNNASFARAFAKRYGACPTSYRRALADAPETAPHLAA